MKNESTTSKFSARRWLPLVALIAVVIFMITSMFGDSDEEQIKAIGSLVESRASFLTSESVFERLAISKELLQHARDPVQVMDKDGKIKTLTQKELLPKLTGLRAKLKRVKTNIHFDSLTVRGKEATAIITVNALGQASGETEPFLDRHKVSVDLVKENGTWLVSGGRYIANLRE